MIYHSKLSPGKLLRMASAAVLCFGISTGLYSDTNNHEQFLRGQDYYNAGDYEAAITAFSEAAASAPETSVYYHWLGRSYGQLAKNSGLLKAYRLSQKTREALERAVELDQGNAEAMADLIKYYEQAPSFLGGGTDKAERMRKQLEALETRIDQSES